MTSAPETLKPSDVHQLAAQTLSDAHVPQTEIVGMHIFHAPSNPGDVNGFTFVLRDAHVGYTISLREGVHGDGLEPIPAAPFQSGGTEFNELVEARSDILQKLQDCVAEIAPLMSGLMADIKV